MDPSPSTAAFLSLLDAFSGNKLSRRQDLGTLIELASHAQGKSMLDELSFYAKFISKCHGIMVRIGSKGEGYDKLTVEFTTNIEKAKGALGAILRGASSDVNTHFTSTYLTMTPESFQNLLALFYDLSWYKNWDIDTSGGTE